MDSVLNNWTLLQLDFSIRISPDQSLCAAPRSFSQLATSFIACQCQGILHALLVAWPPRIFFGNKFFVSTLTLKCRNKSQHLRICFACHYYGFFPISNIFYFSMNTDFSILTTEVWWAYLELNQGPRPYQGRALTNWAIRPVSLKSLPKTFWRFGGA